MLRNARTIKLKDLLKPLSGSSPITQNPASFQKQGFDNLSMASPFKKGSDYLLTFYDALFTLISCAPNSQKSQDDVSLTIIRNVK